MKNDMRPTDPACFNGQELLTPREAATYLRVSKSYLDKLRVYAAGHASFAQENGRSCIGNPT